jgi:hypothetical protein
MSEPITSLGKDRDGNEYFVENVKYVPPTGLIKVTRSDIVAMERDIEPPEGLVATLMRLCSECGHEHNAKWYNCPHCSCPAGKPGMLAELLQSDAKPLTSADFRALCGRKADTPQQSRQTPKAALRRN